MSVNLCFVKVFQFKIARFSPAEYKTFDIIPENFIVSLKAKYESWGCVPDMTSIAFEQLAVALPDLLHEISCCPCLVCSSRNYKCIVGVGFFQSKLYPIVFCDVPISVITF